MPKILLPPGCAGFADGNQKYPAENGPGSFVNLDEDRDAGALRKLKNQDYASAGLVDAGPEKQFIRKARVPGRWCKSCNRLWQAWSQQCNKCGADTISEIDMERPPPPRDIHGGFIP
jgi:hypothetical protein